MKNKEAIAAVVILYYPAEDVVDNIKSYYNHVEKIYVFDNTEIPTSTIKGQFDDLPKVEFYHDQKNEGIAKRLNQAAKLALSENYEWLLTMDQDSKFSNEAIEAYLQCFEAYTGKDTVGMFGTEYGGNPKVTSTTCNPTNAENLITSGALLNLALYKKIGDFDENLFIDSVDHDYCIRTKLLGFKIIKFNNVYIQHRLGEEVLTSSIKTLFLVKKIKKVHPPVRCYYMYRNMLYVENKFKDSELYLAVNLRKIVSGNLKNSIFYGRSPIKVLRYLLRAYKDFKKNKMGK